LVLQLPPSLYEGRGRNAKCLGNGDQIGLMGFEEAEQRREQYRVIRLAAKLICPDSGQVEEPSRPALVAKRCRKCG
jgi:hypothetical protein